VRALAILAILTSAALLPALTSRAQSSAAPVPVRKPAQVRGHSAKPAASRPAAPPAPAQYQTPNWPANDPPSKASVVWNSHGLRIQAANSSLEQILHEVSAETGAKVQGFSTDQRVFGNYGPGAMRDVLSQLLEGSGYNVLMVGGQGSGAPLEIVLSERPVGAPPPVVQNQPVEADDNSAETDQQPQPPPVPAPIRTGFAPGMEPRTPQQIMEEMRERQQQMLERQNNNPQY
jgi:hypothetical protein